jgi:hypothetical protein
MHELRKAMADLPLPHRACARTGAIERDEGAPTLLNVYVRTQRLSERVMASLRKQLGKLKLRVHEATAG